MLGNIQSCKQHCLQIVCVHFMLVPPPRLSFFLYAGGSHCNLSSCYLIKIVVVVVVIGSFLYQFLPCS